MDCAYTKNMANDGNLYINKEDCFIFKVIFFLLFLPFSWPCLSPYFLFSRLLCFDLSIYLSIYLSLPMVCFNLLSYIMYWTSYAYINMFKVLTYSSLLLFCLKAENNNVFFVEKIHRYLVLGCKVEVRIILFPLYSHLINL